MIPQEERILTFARKAYGPRTFENTGIKLGEETGEILREINRIGEGRIGNLDGFRAEIGDALFVLAQLAAMSETTLQAELDKAEARNLVRAGQAPAIPGTPAFSAGPPMMTTKHHWQCTACGWVCDATTYDQASEILRNPHSGAPRSCTHPTLTPYHS